eukprot:13088918-Heterocapsa_arctica.AAC.1
MTKPKETPKAKPLMAKPKAEQKARSTTPKPGHVVRRDMAREFGSTLGQQHPLTPRLSTRAELRHDRFSAADWLRLSGGA